jgi:MFS family permease
MNVETSLKQHLHNIWWSIIYIVVAVSVIFFFAWLYVKTKRWLSKAKIEREKTDFKTKKEYIERTGKKLNILQRFMLTQTGYVFDSYSVHMIIVFIIIGFIGGVFTANFDLFHQSNGGIFVVGIAVFWLMLLVMFYLMIFLIWSFIIDLIEYARIMLFLFYLLLFILMMVCFWILFNLPRLSG